MIPVRSDVRIWLATGCTDMRRGMFGLALQVQQGLKRDPHAGDLYIFRGRRGTYLKALHWDGSGICLFAKRLERHRFVWPPLVEGGVVLTAAQFGLLIEAMDWRRTIAPAAPRIPVQM